MFVQLRVFNFLLKKCKKRESKICHGINGNLIVLRKLA